MCKLRLSELDLEKSRGEARKAVTPGIWCPGETPWSRCIPGVLFGGEAQNLLTGRKGEHWQLDQDSPVLQGR